ncbi:MAG: hypothetical protein FWG70_09685 [Oscillospiraceae bacterium]|nr:hypothetical protein [Oscillospiraceae bacterium]
MKSIKIKRKTIIIIAIPLIIILILLWIVMFLHSYENACREWNRELMYKTDSLLLNGESFNNLNFFDYNALASRYKRLISMEDFYSLNPETMIPFFINVNNVDYKCASQEKMTNYGVKRGPAGFVETSDTKYSVSFDFIIRPHFITFKPTVQYWEITIYEIDKEGNRTLIE